MNYTFTERLTFWHASDIAGCAYEQLQSSNQNVICWILTFFFTLLRENSEKCENERQVVKQVVSPHGETQVQQCPSPCLQNGYTSALVLACRMSTPVP